MSVISMFSAVFCEAESVLKQVAAKAGCKVVNDGELVKKAALLSGLAEAKIEKAFHSATSVFNAFSHEKERAVSWLRLATAKTLAEEDKIIISGSCALLIPASIEHVLKVCLLGDTDFRLQQAKNAGLNEKDAHKQMKKSDEDQAAWGKLVNNIPDVWKQDLYDIVLPMHKTELQPAVELICEQYNNRVVAISEASRQAVADFLLATEVETTLGGHGHNVLVSAKDGKVTLAINKHVLLFDKLSRELSEIATKVKGVKEIETKAGKEYHQTDIYRRIDFEMPSKVLLVDDEREFVQTLSERLLLRDMGSVAVYDGESALDMVSRDEPEVMILDLKMPGIDGIEVLRQVKQANSAIEVIILTGHGTEADRETCMQLGAFAYLNKPVDIDILSKTLKEANDKIKQAN